MLAPRAVKRKAFPPVATSSSSKAAEKAAGDSADSATDSFRADDQSVQAAEAGSVAQGDILAGQLADDHDATDTRDTSDDTEAQNRAQNQQKLLVAVEEAVSDWGLSLQNRELLIKLQSSADGCEVRPQALASVATRHSLRLTAPSCFTADVHVSNLLQVRTIAAIADSIADITAALQAVPSVRVEVSPVGLRMPACRL